MSSQRGFTVMELLVSIAITGLLTPLVISSIFQIIMGTDKINGRTLALSDIHNAAAWLNQDLSLARKLLDQATLDPLVECSVGTQPNVRAEWIDETV